MKKACELTGKSRATVYRRRHGIRSGCRERRPAAPNALSACERGELLAILDSVPLENRIVQVTCRSSVAPPFHDTGRPASATAQTGSCSQIRACAAAPATPPGQAVGKQCQENYVAKLGAPSRLRYSKGRDSATPHRCSRGRAAPAPPTARAARSSGLARVMAKIGYARVSTRSQNDDSQVDDLNAYGCDKIFTDTASGKLAARPELDRALAYLREGDVLVITRLSRAMRSLKHLLALADELRERGVGLVVLRQQIDTTTPTGRLAFHILGAIDEFQRELIVEGTREGLEAARARGRTGGRKPKLNARQAATVRRMYQATGPDGKRQHTVAEIAEAVDVHRTTVYDYLKKER